MAPDSGCVGCQTVGVTIMSQGCVGTPCVIDATRISDVVQANCPSAPAPNFSNWSCYGHVGYLNGETCLIEPVATGAIRWSVSCGACITIVTEN